MLQINLFGSSFVFASFCFRCFVVMVVVVMIILIMLILTWIVAFFVMLDFAVIRDAFEMGLELAMTLTFRQRADLHVDVTACHLGILIHVAHRQKIFLNTGSEGVAQLLMRHLAATKLKLNAHFMTFREKVFRVDDFDLVVVRVDADAEFQLLHLATFLVLVSFLLVLLLHVLVFAVIDNFADGRIGGSRDFDEIETAFFGHAQSNGGDKNTVLLIRYAIDDANLRRANALVNASLIHVASILRTTIQAVLSWAIEITT